MVIATGLLGDLRLAQENYSDAERLLRESVVGREKVQPGVWETYRTKSQLGSALVGQARAVTPDDAQAADKKFGEAETLLLSSYEGLKPRGDSVSTEQHRRQLRVIERLIELYIAWDKPDDAARWREERSEGVPNELR